MSLCSKIKKVNTFLARRMKSLREGWDEDEARRMKSNPEGWNHRRRKLSKPRFRHSATLIANVVELALLSIHYFPLFPKNQETKKPNKQNTHIWTEWFCFHTVGVALKVCQRSDKGHPCSKFKRTYLPPFQDQSSTLIYWILYSNNPLNVRGVWYGE